MKNLFVGVCLLLVKTVSAQSFTVNQIDSIVTNIDAEKDFNVKTTASSTSYPVEGVGTITTKYTKAFFKDARKGTLHKVVRTSHPGKATTINTLYYFNEKLILTKDLIIHPDGLKDNVFFYYNGDVLLHSNLPRKEAEKYYKSYRGDSIRLLAESKKVK